MAKVATDIISPARASLAAGWLGAAGAVRTASAGIGRLGVLITSPTGGKADSLPARPNLLGYLPLL
jgi:hypothetical protein